MSPKNTFSSYIKIGLVVTLVSLCSLAQSQPVAFKVDMGYACELSAKRAKFSLEIYGSNGRFFQQFFDKKDRTTESMVAVSVGNWKTKNINSNGDRVFYDGVYRLDILRHTWNVTAGSGDRKFYEDVALSKSRSDLFYVVDESRTAAEATCQEHSELSARMLELSDEYTKRAEETAEKYRSYQKEMKSITREQAVGQLVEADRAIKQLEKYPFGGKCNANSASLRSMLNNIANQLSDYNKTVEKMYGVSQQNGEMFVKNSNLYGYFFSNTTPILEDARRAVDECGSGRVH